MFLFKIREVTLFKIPFWGCGGSAALPETHPLVLTFPIIVSVEMFVTCMREVASSDLGLVIHAILTEMLGEFPESPIQNDPG
jgi:hypothetical protein